MTFDVSLSPHYHSDALLVLVRGTKMRTLPFSMVFFHGSVCAAAVGFSCEIGFFVVLEAWRIQYHQSLVHFDYLTGTPYC